MKKGLFPGLMALLLCCSMLPASGRAMDQDLRDIYLKAFQEAYQDTPASAPEEPHFDDYGRELGPDGEIIGEIDPSIAYEEAFGPSILSEGAEPPAVTPDAPDKLYARRMGEGDKGAEWSGLYVPEEYLSEAPEDVAALVLVTRRVEVAATYTGGAKVRRAIDTVSLFDPYRGQTIATEVFGHKNQAPDTTYGSYTMEPAEEFITSWVRDTWENYLATGAVQGGEAPASDFNYDISGGSARIIQYLGKDSIVVVPAQIEGAPVTRIYDYAFRENTSLAAVTLPEGLTTIGKYAFADCENLGSISIPPSVTSIGNGAFNRCRAIADITLPPQLRSIGAYTFYMCSSLPAIELPASVTAIDEYAFGYCGFQAVTLPEGIRVVSDHLFYMCESLASVSLPDSVTEIQDHALSCCYSLAELRLSGNIESIHWDAFSSSENITILCPEGSYAQEFCEERSIPWQPL